MSWVRIQAVDLHVYLGMTVKSTFAGEL